MVLLITPIILDIRMYVYLKRLYKGIMVLLLTPIHNSRHTNVYVYLKIILRRLSLTKQRNAIIIVLYFLSALRVINETYCCKVHGTRTEAEFMNVQLR